MCMASPVDSATRVTLLQRLARSGTPDQVAWREFVEHYGRKIYQWCRHWKLQEADARDVTQNVLLKMAERIKDFRYDPARASGPGSKRSRTTPGGTTWRASTGPGWEQTAKACSLWKPRKTW